MKERNRDTPFSSMDVSALFGITLRQIDYWVKTRLIQPSRVKPKRAAREFTFLDLIQLRTVKALLDRGMSIQKIRQSLDYIKHEFSFNYPATAVLITDGRTIFRVVQKKDDFIEAVDTLEHQGQGVFLFNLGKLQEEVKEKVKQLSKVA